MADTWTSEAVLALAPDSASAQAGRGLANRGKWVSLGTDGVAVWGEAKGSGANPYQVAIHLSEPAFRCSCPSRKFPCKHGLGLFLLFAQGAAPAGSAPAFVQEWLAKRQSRQQNPTIVKAPDPAGQAKRADQREGRIRAGIQDCAMWLRDTVRQGLASPAVATDKHFESMAARMVDAQAPGLARRLREMGDLVHAGAGWQERMLARIADLYLILEAHRRLEELPPELREDVASAIGVPRRKEDLPAEGQISDVWSVVAQYRFQEERLSVQRSWLWGRTSGRWAMVLAFSAANAPFDPLLSPGTAFRGALAFYPGAERLRAAILGREDTAFGSPEGTGLPEFLDGFADRLARCPWTELSPAALRDVTWQEPGRVVDSAGLGLPLVAEFEPWRCLAITGGRPAMLFGEWDGYRLRPLALINEGRWFRL